MGKAARIMKKKKFIKDEMDRLLEKEISDAVWLGAERRLDAILQEYCSLPKGVRTHTDTFIFPAAAVYLSVKDIAGDYEEDVLGKQRFQKQILSGKEG